MQEERGLQDPRGNVEPINRPVKQVQLAGVSKGVKDKGRQAKDIKVAGFARRPAPEKDEGADEEVEQAHQRQVVPHRAGGALGVEDETGVKGFAVASQTVVGKRPDTELVNLLHRFRGGGNGLAIDRLELVALADSGTVGGPALERQSKPSRPEGVSIQETPSSGT